MVYASLIRGFARHTPASDRPLLTCRVIAQDDFMSKLRRRIV